jgi:hypothetical protein
MPTIPPRIEKTNPEMEIASPPQRSGNRFPTVDPTNKPIQTNFFVIATSCANLGILNPTLSHPHRERELY